LKPITKAIDEENESLNSDKSDSEDESLETLSKNRLNP
jgi:hypothetical protein